jgi:hypothetical protein
MRCKLFISIIMIFYAVSAAWAADPVDKQPVFSQGIIFNSQIPLSLVSSYEGGIGYKLANLRLGDLFFNLRFLLSLQIVDGFNDYQTKLGATIELPLFKPGWLNPYGGLVLEGGVDRLLSPLVDVTTFVYSAKLLLGIEILILDYLSIFAEYALSLDFTTEVDSTSGVPVTTTSWQIASGVGNSASIGIILYFRPVLEKKAGPGDDEK